MFQARYAQGGYASNFTDFLYVHLRFIVVRELNLSFWFGLLVRYVSDVNGVFRHLFRGMLVLVEVGACDGQDLAVVREAEAGDAGVVLVELAEALLVLSIPNIDQPL